MFQTDRILGFMPVDWRLELTRYPWVRALLKSRWMPFVPIVVNLFIFTVILMAGYYGGTSPGNYNFGIMIVWIVWWVVLMMVLVPGGSRAWCIGCPLPVLGEWMQRLTLVGVRHNKKGNFYLGLKKRWPKSLSNMWIMNFLFLATTFTTGFITTRPIATFIMLGAIIALAIVLSMVYHKRAFCLYVCPVSGFQGLYSNFAITEVRVKDPSICKGHKNKGCVVGNEQGYGCPWMLLPYTFKRNTYCGMCFECFKTCEYDNMAFNLRPPGTDLLVDDNRRLDESWKAFIMLGISIFFFLVMQGPWGLLKDWANAETWGGYVSFIGLHSLFNLAVIPAVFLGFVWWSRRMADAREVSLKKAYINFSYTLVPLGLVAWIAFSFGILLPNSSYVLHILSDPFAWGWDLFGTAHFPWTPFWTGAMPWIQAACLLVGLLLCLDFAYKLARQTYCGGAPAGQEVVPVEALAARTVLTPEQGEQRVQRGFIPIALFLTLSTAALLWLFIG